eukprot:scaffold1169_cov367-Prasinococcus_capsulatus_cf.AAC.16
MRARTNERNTCDEQQQRHRRCSLAGWLVRACVRACVRAFERTHARQLFTTTAAGPAGRRDGDRSPRALGARARPPSVPRESHHPQPPPSERVGAPAAGRGRRSPLAVVWRGRVASAAVPARAGAPDGGARTSRQGRRRRTLESRINKRAARRLLAVTADAAHGCSCA